MLVRDFKRRFQKISMPTVMMCVVAYFVFHILSGQHGVLSWYQLNYQLIDNKQRLAELMIKHDKLEHRVTLD